MALMQAVFVVISVAIGIIVAVSILTNLAPTANNFSCPDIESTDKDLARNLKQGCSIFQQMGGILLIIVPIIAVAIVILLFTRNAF